LEGDEFDKLIKTPPLQGLIMVKMKKMRILKKVKTYEKWELSFSFFSNLSENFTSQTEYVGMYSCSRDYIAV
jgi:hypothetical protein